MRSTYAINSSCRASWCSNLCLTSFPTGLAFRKALLPMFSNGVPSVDCSSKRSKRTPAESESREVFGESSSTRLSSVAMRARFQVAPPSAMFGLQLSSSKHSVILPDCQLFRYQWTTWLQRCFSSLTLTDLDCSLLFAACLEAHSHESIPCCLCSGLLLIRIAQITTHQFCARVSFGLQLSHG